ncbi:hypothetical protein ACRYKR_19485 [Escherichia coli]
MKIRPQQHLINILTSTKQHHPNFTLFLGAGASISSGVDSAGGMIRRWRDAYTLMYGEDALKNKFGTIKIMSIQSFLKHYMINQLKEENLLKVVLPQLNHLGDTFISQIYWIKAILIQFLRLTSMI